jgi:hypothetical protein
VLKARGLGKMQIAARSGPYRRRSVALLRVGLARCRMQIL